MSFEPNPKLKEIYAASNTVIFMGITMIGTSFFIENFFDKNKKNQNRVDFLVNFGTTMTIYGAAGFGFIRLIDFIII